MKCGLANAIKIFREKNPEFFVNNFLYSSSDFAFKMSFFCHIYQFASLMIRTKKRKLMVYLWRHFQTNLADIQIHKNITFFTSKNTFKKNVNRNVFTDCNTILHFVQTNHQAANVWLGFQLELFCTNVDNWRPQRRVLKGHVDPLELNSPVTPFYPLIDSRQSEQKI